MGVLIVFVDLHFYGFAVSGEGLFLCAANVDVFWCGVSGVIEIDAREHSSLTPYKTLKVLFKVINPKKGNYFWLLPNLPSSARSPIAAATFSVVHPWRKAGCLF